MGRLVSKTVPGAGTTVIVYDPLNRPVLTQDGIMSALHQWNYIKYDVKGRVASTGTYSNSTPADTGRVNMQNYVNGISGYSTLWYESRMDTVKTGQYYYTGYSRRRILRR
jgi:hypothetical protein